MDVTCLIVAGIAGLFCHVNAPAPATAVCHDVEDVHLCLVDAHELDLWASFYDPANGDINCYLDTCDHLGDGTLVTDALYGTVAACPFGWYGRWVETEFGTVQCRDHGGDVKPVYRTVYKNGRGFYQDWVIVVDYLLPAIDSIGTPTEWWVYQTWDFSLTNDLP